MPNMLYDVVYMTKIVFMRFIFKQLFKFDTTFGDLCWFRVGSTKKKDICIFVSIFKF